MDNSDQSNDQQSGGETNLQYKPSASPEQGYDGSSMSEATGIPLQQIPAVSWSASEYVAHEKSAGWYFALFGATTLLVTLIYILTKDILASVVILLASMVIGVYAARKPSTKSYEINEQGIQIDSVMHHFREFRSFSVIEEGALDSVWLKPLKRFSPVVAMYFPPEDEEKIVDVLSNFLPHEQRELDAIDRFSKRMRF